MALKELPALRVWARVLTIGLALESTTLACSAALPEIDLPFPNTNATAEETVIDTMVIPGSGVADGNESGNSVIDVDGDATLTLANYSRETICQVYISPTTDYSWNDDWLDGQEIGPGGAHAFTVAEGAYDLQATGCDGDEIDLVWDAFLTDDSTWRITDADVAEARAGGSNIPGDATLTLVNNSGRTICYVYISPVIDTYWNDNWLGRREMIAPGESYVFSVASDDYDLRAADCDHNEIDVVWGMSVSDGQVWTIP